MRDSEVPLRRSLFGRRDFIKLGAGASATVTLLNACGGDPSGASSEQAQQNPQPSADGENVKEDPVQRVLPKVKWGEIGPGGGGGGGVQRGGGYRFYRIIPPEVMEISIGLGLAEYDPEGVQKAAMTYPAKVDALAKEGVDFILLAGVPVSAQLGRDRVLEMLAETTRRTGIRADATLEALLAGMTHLGVKTIAVGSRWPDQLNQAMADYCKKGGVDVVSMTSRGQTLSNRVPTSFEEQMRLELELAYEAVRKAPDADGVLIPGGVMAEHVIVPIEEEFGKPVFTNLNAEVWNNLIRTKAIPPIQGWGRLLATA